jgi:hypothetical protein
MIGKNNNLMFILSCLLLSLYVNTSFLKLKSKIMVKQQNFGSITLTVDNYLRKITVNGEEIPLSGDIDNWYVGKTIDLPVQIKAGDIIAIHGENADTTSPAAMIATITYNDENGIERKISTGDKWTCDGGAPRLQGGNADQSTVWNQNSGTFAGIEDHAQWIWNQQNAQQSICQFSIPVESASTPKRCNRKN